MRSRSLACIFGAAAFPRGNRSKDLRTCNKFQKVDFLFLFKSTSPQVPRVLFACPKTTHARQALAHSSCPAHVLPLFAPLPPTKLPRRTARRHSGGHRAETFQPSGAKLWGGGCKAFGRAGGLARRSRRSLRFPWGAPRGDIPAVGRDARAGCKAFGRARGASPAIAEVFALSLGRSSATVVVFGLFLKLSGCLV